MDYESIAWRKLFTYSAGKLFWNSRGSGVSHCGTQAGTYKDKDGYHILMHKKKQYRVHKIIWYMLRDPIPEGMQIDHINGRRSDNRIQNLRVVNHQGNSKNAQRRSDNSSGVVGVSWLKKRKKWRAYIGRPQQFLGEFKILDDAIAARKNAEKELGFHPNHGRIATHA